MTATPESLWRIAPMHPEHLPQVLAIERAAYAFPWTEGIFNDCLRVGYSSWIVCNTLGEVQGYALMSLAAGEAHVLNVCVSPQRRGLGLGRYLMRHLLRLAEAGSVERMFLEVRRSNEEALRLYEHLGFSQVGTRKGYYPAAGGREDALVLALDIVPACGS